MVILTNKRSMRNDELFTGIRELVQRLQESLDEPKWHEVDLTEIDESLEELERRLTAKGTPHENR